jgi:hypothetical protein
MLQLNLSERVDFYRVLENNRLIKLCQSYDSDFINNIINNDNILNLISKDLLKQTEAVLGFVKNEKTLELSSVCYYKIIELEIGDENDKETDKEGNKEG